jgi:hypothetical protein
VHGRRRCQPDIHIPHGSRTLWTRNAQSHTIFARRRGEPVPDLNIDPLPQTLDASVDCMVALPRRFVIGKPVPGLHVAAKDAKVARGLGFFPSLGSVGRSSSSSASCALAENDVGTAGAKFVGRQFAFEAGTIEDLRLFDKDCLRITSCLYTRHYSRCVETCHPTLPDGSVAISCLS